MTYMFGDDSIWESWKKKKKKKVLGKGPLISFMPTSYIVQTFS